MPPTIPDQLWQSGDTKRMGNALQLVDPPPVTTRRLIPSLAITGFRASPPRHWDTIAEQKTHHDHPQDDHL
jgi:hypothetical protein